MMGKNIVMAMDSLKIHFTTVGNSYEFMDEDDECYKITDDRGKVNWIPKRYFQIQGRE